MAFDPLPTSFFGDGFAVTGHAVVLPTSEATDPLDVVLPELTDAEAAADWRKSVFALMDALFHAYDAIPLADRPAAVTISKSKSSNVSTGVDTNSFSVQIKTSSSGTEVIAE